MGKLMVLISFRQRRSKVSSADDGHPWNQILVSTFVAEEPILEAA